MNRELNTNQTKDETNSIIAFDENDLISRAKQGDLEAFNSLILHYQDFLFRVAMRTISDEDQAADAVQDACIKAFEKFSTFQGESLRSWLARIVINFCYDQIRRKYRHPIQSLTSRLHEDEPEESDYWLSDASANPERQLEITELDRTIQACLETLPSPFRAILILIDIEEMSYEDAAQVLRVPVGTIKSRLSRARAQMRAALCYKGETLSTLYLGFAQC